MLNRIRIRLLRDFSYFSGASSTNSPLDGGASHGASSSWIRGVKNAGLILSASFALGTVAYADTWSLLKKRRDDAEKSSEKGAASVEQGGQSSSSESKFDDPLSRSKKGEKVAKDQDLLILAGNANKGLASKICDRLGSDVGKMSLGRFADGEVSVKILESVRGKSVYIIQPTSSPVNEHLMELLLMISTCRRASAKRITAVIPYYGYARQDRKMNSRVPISAADVARLLETMGVDRVVAVDLHCGQIQGFFGPRVPVDNLGAQMIGWEHFASKDLKKVVVVSPDAGGVYRARKFQEGLVSRGVGDVSLAMLVKQRSGANQIERMDLVGNVSGADVIIVDDMVDTAGTLCEAASELKKHGALNVYAFATHGLFNGKAIERIEASPLQEVVVTDSVALNEKAAKCGKIRQLTIAVMLADCIRRIDQKESLHALFGDD